MQQSQFSAKQKPFESGPLVPTNSEQGNWTDATDAEAAAFFDSLPVAEIRRRQHLCNLQLEMAYSQKNDKALDELGRMEQALMDSMMRRCA